MMMMMMKAKTLATTTTTTTAIATTVWMPEIMLLMTTMMMAGLMPVTILPETLFFKNLPPPLRLPTTSSSSSSSSSTHQSLKSIPRRLNLKKILSWDHLSWLIRMEKNRFVILLTHLCSSSTSSSFYLHLLFSLLFFSCILPLAPLNWCITIIIIIMIILGLEPRTDFEEKKQNIWNHGEN